MSTIKCQFHLLVVLNALLFGWVGVYSLSTGASLGDFRYPWWNSKIRFRCRIAYDGTAFSGFQVQGRSVRTVQGEVEKVLCERFNRQGIRVVAAGRTDAGVHAKGQALHFDLNPSEVQLDNQEWERSLETAMNRMLPTDIQVYNVGVAPHHTYSTTTGGAHTGTWNVMHQSTAKLYSYRLCLAAAMDPIDGHNRWQVNSGHSICPKHLGHVLQHYDGTHNFACFANALEAATRRTGTMPTTTRTIHSCHLLEEDPDRRYFRIDIKLSGALYKMIRNMVGTALEVCSGRLSEVAFLELLQATPRSGCDRARNPCKPAPPHGLSLENVFFLGDTF